jgi:hypothetical protein
MRTDGMRPLFAAEYSHVRDTPSFGRLRRVEAAVP